MQRGGEIRHSSRLFFDCFVLIGNSTERAPILWSTLAGWEVLIDSQEGDVSLSSLMKIIEKDAKAQVGDLTRMFVGNAMTTAEQIESVHQGIKLMRRLSFSHLIMGPLTHPCFIAEVKCYHSPWIMPLYWEPKDWLVLSKTAQSVAGSRFPEGSSMLLTFDVQFLEGVLMKNKDVASSRDIQLICAEFSRLQSPRLQADWMLLAKFIFQSSRYVVPTGRVVVPTGQVWYPAGKVINHSLVLVRLSLVPTGRVLSPGRVK
ncbi:hypothetical protein Tco_0237483 [Tanacetum coccineum]